MRRLAGPLLLLIASPAATTAEPLPDRPAFCEVTPCLPGLAHRRVLSRDERLGKVLCKRKEEVGVTADGAPMYCTTAGAQTVDNVPLAAGAYTLLYPTGRVYQSKLGRKAVLPTGAGKPVTCAPDTIALTDAGVVTYCTLAAPLLDSKVDAKVDAGVAFHPDGHLARATLKQPLQLGALALPAGTAVMWDPAGVALGGTLTAPLVVGALTIRGDFTLHPGGALRTCELAAKATIQGHEFPEWQSSLELAPDGKLVRARWTANRGFMPHGEMWTDTRTATFDPAGKIVTSSDQHWQAETPPPRLRKR
jgi:hypothetical protein